MSKEKSYSWLRAVLTFCLLFWVSSYASELESSSERLLDQKILAEFKIARGGDPILLPVIFKGKEYLFLLDTGFSHTAFNSSFKHELGHVKRIERGITLGNPMMFEVFDAPEAFLGPFNIQDCGEVSCIDLNMVSSIFGRKVAGLIGLNFLKKYVIQIDFDKGVLSFLQPIRGQNPDWGQELEINYDSIGQPNIIGNIHNGIKVGFVIDTGCNTTGGLDRKIFEEILSKKEVKTSEALLATASGIVQNREARISGFSVGPFEYEDLIFDEGNWSYLGLLFLARHIVILDFPNNRIYLKKGRDFKKIDETDMSGLHLLRISNKTIVHSVDEDSPAQKAGISADDVILKVGDKGANKYEMWELRRILRSKDKRKIVMTIQRGDDVKEVSFLLKRKI